MYEFDKKVKQDYMITENAFLKRHISRPRPSEPLHSSQYFSLGVFLHTSKFSPLNKINMSYFFVMLAMDGIIVLLTSDKVWSFWFTSFSKL